MATAISTNYYAKAVDLSDADGVEQELKRLVQAPIQSVEDLESHLTDRLIFTRKVEEVMSGHAIDFYRDTENADKKAIHLHDQAAIAPLMAKYGAELNRKFCECPYVAHLDDAKYGRMRLDYTTDLELFREENIPLQVRETEVCTRYNEVIGSLTATFQGETKPYPYIVAALGNPDRNVRKSAWIATREARKTIKADCDEMMSELVQLRHQIALNAGFENYRDYSFKALHREYTVEDCKRLHEVVAKHVVPVWERLAKSLQKELGVDTYRPWDTGPCTLSGAPFQTVEELMDGVEDILGKVDPYFQNRFQYMRTHDLLDLESRKGKAPGGFCDFLQHSQNTFVFANFSPSFFAVIALLHEMGHAINGYLQVREEPVWSAHRAEVAELYSHSMELLCLDGLDRFYANPKDFRNAKRESLNRSIGMLRGPLSGDLFQHWIYENPDHTAEERDAKFREITLLYSGNAVDFSGYEEECGQGWIDTIHYFAYPFYNIEYTMSELGALQLFETYRRDKALAISQFKHGAAADYTQSIAEIYQDTGVTFDFTEKTVARTAKFIEEVIEELK